MLQMIELWAGLLWSAGILAAWHTVKEGANHAADAPHQTQRQALAVPWLNIILLDESRRK